MCSKHRALDLTRQSLSCHTLPLMSPKPCPLTHLPTLSYLRAWAVPLGTHSPHVHWCLDNASLFLHPPHLLSYWSLVWTPHTHLKAYL